MPQLFRMGLLRAHRRTAGWPWPWTTGCASGASAGTSSTARGTPWSGGASPGASPAHRQPGVVLPQGPGGRGGAAHQRRLDVGAAGHPGPSGHTGRSAARGAPGGLPGGRQHPRVAGDALRRRGAPDPGGQPAFQGAEGQWALQQQIDRRTAVLPPGREPPPRRPGVVPLRPGQHGDVLREHNAAKVVQRFAPDKLATVTVPLPPTRTRRVSGSNTDWIAVGRSAKAQDPAWELLKLHIEPEALVAFNESVFFIPPRKSASEKAAYMQQPFMKRAVDFLDRFGMAMPLVPSYARLNPFLEGEIRAAFGGEKSAAQALEPPPACGPPSSRRPAGRISPPPCSPCPSFSGPLTGSERASPGRPAVRSGCSWASGAGGRAGARRPAPAAPGRRRPPLTIRPPSTGCRRSRGCAGGARCGSLPSRGRGPP